MKLSLRVKIGAAVTLLIILLAVLNFPSINRGIKNFFYTISSPIQKTFWQMGDKVSDFFEMISEIKNLKKENEELKLKTQGLLAENSYLKELRKENEALREALQIGLEKEFKLVFTKVIGKDISQDTILIDKGSKSGISKDSPVITQQKILVGKINEVYPNFARVMLPTHKDSSFDAKTVTGEVYGLLKGRGNFKLFLDLLPREKEVKEGELIVTTPLGGIFPEGILIGKVTQVKKLDIESFQQAEISPFFDIKELKSVFIITE